MSFISSWHSYGHLINLWYDFCYFKKKLLNPEFGPKNGLWSLQRAWEASNRKIWSCGVWNLLDLSKWMLFHIEVDIIQDLGQKFENRKKSFQIFSFLTIFLTVAFRGLYRRHKMTTTWAFLSDLRPMCNDTLLWGRTKYVPLWDYNIFLDFSSISIIFGVEVGMDHNFFPTHLKAHTAFFWWYIT